MTIQEVSQRYQIPENTGKEYEKLGLWIQDQCRKQESMM